MRHDLYIGIDTGKNTGIAIWLPETKQFTTIQTVHIHKAMELVLECSLYGKVKVRFEDARLRKWFGKAGKEQLQGAGSIKRDAVIWEDYLTDKKIAFECVAPKNNKTKLSAVTFKATTKYLLRTTVHSRDAAMLVFGMQ